VIYLNRSDEILLENFRNVLEEKDAENITMIDMSTTPLPVDYFVICTGNSHTHLRALRDETLAEIDKTDMKILYFDKGKEYEWMIIDTGEIVFHFFTRKGREFYALEDLWMEAKRV